MTSETTPASSTDSSGAPAEPTTAKKTPRRRATRSAAAPRAAAPETGSTVAATTEAASTPTEQSTPTSAPAEPAEAPAAPKKRASRRVTRTTATPAADAAPADGADAAAPAVTTDVAPATPPTKKAAAAPLDVPADVPADVAETPETGTGRARRSRRSTTRSVPAESLDVLSEFGLRAGADEPASAPRTVTVPDADTLLGTAEPEARAPRRRSGRRASAAPNAQDAVEQAVPAEQAPATEQSTDPTSTPDEPASDAPAETTTRRRKASVTKAPAKKTSRTKKAPAAEAQGTEVPSADESGTAASAPAAPAAVATEAEAPAAEAPAEKAPARRRRRATSATTSAPAVEQDTAASEKSANEPAEPASQQESTVQVPAQAAPADAAPASRPATTALLFQAPDATAAPRRSRRAQSPAGPPKTVEPEASTRATAPAQKSTARSDDSSGDTAADAPNRARDAVAAIFSEDELAAIEAVERLETELVADGVDLADEAFAPEDFDEDADGAEGLDDEDDGEPGGAPRRRRRRGGRGRRNRQGGEGGSDDDNNGGDRPTERSGEVVDGDDATAPEPGATEQDESDDSDEGGDGSSSRRRRRRRRGGRSEGGESTSPARGRSSRERTSSDEVTALKGSTRLEAKRQRRREGRDAGRRRQIITEAEFLARRESVERSMVVRERGGRTQIAVLEDGVLVEHYVSQQSQVSMAGNVYLGRVQNVLPSMEAAFIDVGKGRNAVLYAGEVNWDAAGLEGQPRRIEQALKSGDSVLVQVTKDPIGHKGARLTSQVTLAGRYLVFVPGGGMTGISRKLPDTERARLKKILKEVVPDGAGVIVRTAAEGASEDELRADVERLRHQWESITEKAAKSSTHAPALLQGEPDLAIRVVRDIFNDDFSSLVVQGDGAWGEISSYVEELAPDLRERVSRWTSEKDVFAEHRVDEQLAKGMDRKVWLPSGGSLVIDRTEAMTVVDVNTGKFTGTGGTLEETVTRNNLEAAEEIVRQLRLRDIGGIIVIDFIDMVLESNRDLVLRRLVECLGRDRTKHQVAEVTSLGLVQMTRKRVGQGLVEAFSETCDHCNGRGFVVHDAPIEKSGSSAGNGGGGGHQAGGQPEAGDGDGSRGRARRKRGGAKDASAPAAAVVPVLPEVSSEAREAVKATLATIAAAAAHAHEHPEHDEHGEAEQAHVDPEHTEDQDAQVAAVPEPEPEPEEAAEPAKGDAEGADEMVVVADAVEGQDVREGV
ncbi:Rne/Rng family ribonuclease [Oerskovia flava]|uniref:Rne/Rng family ribonuclease n=1 Tax=Oerskovia flava TaxID=2986422 RepID=UPI00223F1F25|nr:Rne/Rng family ribonuclease [Oerskovia sp. JB1-3-2]